MATRKLKNFEYAGHQNAEAGENTDLHIFDTFETPNGFVLLVAGSDARLNQEQQVAGVISERIRYYLDNEVLPDPAEAVRNALVYANGFVFERARKDEHFVAGNASVLCLLVRDEKAFYAWMGNVALYLYTGKRKYALVSPVAEAAEEADPESLLFLGKNQLAEPASCEQPLVPVDGDMIFMGTGSSWEELREKMFCGVMADSMPTHTKVQRLMRMAGESGGEVPRAAQLLVFYNLDQTERSFVPAESAPAPRVMKRIQDRLTQRPRYPLLRSLLMVAGALLLAYMVYDLFFFDPNPPVRIRPVAEPVAQTDSLEATAGEAAEQETAGRASLPSDVEYTVRSGDTWGSIYRQFEVCSWFIRNHPPNSGKFDASDNPVSNSVLMIPLRYSGSQRLNPGYYQEFSTDKVGNACQNANETFRRRFDEKVRNQN